MEYVTYLSRTEWLQIMHYKIKQETIHSTLHRAQEHVVARRAFQSLQLAVLEDLMHLHRLLKKVKCKTTP